MTVKSPTKKSPSVDAKVKRIRELATRARELSLEFRDQRDERDKPLPMTDKFKHAMFAWSETFDQRSIPVARHAMKNLESALFAFADAERGFQRVSEQASRDTQAWLAIGEYLACYGRFWDHFDDALDRTFREPPTESMWRLSPAKMHAAGVAPRTIAAEWRWYTPHGTLDEHRVLHELDNPGTEWNEAARAERHQFDLEQLGFVIPAAELAKLEP